MAHIFNIDLKLDARKPFYWLLLGSVTQLHGFIELASRGLKIELGAMSSKELDKYLDSFSSDVSERYREMVETSATKLFADLNLQSSVGEAIRPNINALMSKASVDGEAMIRFMMRTAVGSVLILAWELTTQYHNRTPIWEFLRHCRNAAAHSGRFTLRKNEPTKLAKWRDLEITKELNDEMLFRTDEDEGFLQPGDVFYLLEDLDEFVEPISDFP